MSGTDARRELAARIDHTLLRPTATQADVEVVVSEAVSFGCAAVCVAPVWVRFAFEAVGGRIPVASVVGFPHGTSLSATKAAEAAAVTALGAAELDVVADLAALADGDFATVAADVAQVRAAAPDALLKVIVESAAWSDAVLRAACDAALDGGADLVKTSTGFHDAGGATVAAVETMRAVVGSRGGIKASGGVRTLGGAQALVAAGADRLGCSATGSILAELDAAR